MPSEKIQRVAFVRHGVARHNLLDPAGGRPNLEDPALFDPALVFQGKQQALEAGERLKIWWRTTQFDKDVELVVTSPLTRCIQTSMLGFLPGDSYTIDGRREPKFYCTELVREAFGMHYPDKRRQKSILKRHWPILEFDDNMKEFDEAWSPTRRETIDQIETRIAEFFEILVKREETNIIVVSHGVWIEVCLNALCPAALDHGRRRVYNCDLFVGDCISSNGRFIRLQNVHHLR